MRFLVSALLVSVWLAAAAAEDSPAPVAVDAAAAAPPAEAAGADLSSGTGCVVFASH